MTHINESYAAAPNRYRVGQAFVGPNFGLVIIDWEAKSVHFAGCDVRGEEVITQTIPIPSLQPRH